MLTVDTKELRRALAWVCTAIAPKPAQPILGAVKISLADGQLILMGTDQEMSATAYVPVISADGEQPWPSVVCVPGHPLRAMLDVLDGNVVMEAEQALQLTAARRHFRLGRMDERTYPTVPADPHQVGTIEADDLRAAVVAVGSAVYRGAGGGALVGINVVAQDGRMELVACDRFRAHRAFARYSGEPFSALVPGKRLGDIVRTLEGPVEIMADEHMLAVADDARSAHVGIFAAEYPKVETFWQMAKRKSSRTLVNREVLAEAMKAAAVVTENGHVDLVLDGSTITLRGDAETSGSDIEITCDSDASERAVRLNRDYLTDALAALATPHVELLVPSEIATPPVTIRGVDENGETDDDVTTVVMAIKK